MDTVNSSSIELATDEKLHESRVEEATSEIQPGEETITNFMQVDSSVDFKMSEPSVIDEDEWISFHSGRFFSYAFSIFLVLFAIITAVGFLIPAFSSRPQFYLDICKSDSCSSKLDLECINGKCQCPSNKFYASGCKQKKIYLEKCHNISSQCDDSVYLFCLDGSCKCSQINYWNGRNCQAKHLYNGQCGNDNDRCLTSSMLYCDVNKMICQCRSDRLVLMT